MELTPTPVVRFALSHIERYLATVKGNLHTRYSDVISSSEGLFILKCSKQRIK